ncbi:14440_t:CDS:2, partial [Cetraspora pellucida]
PILSDNEIDEELTITDLNYQVSDNENEINSEKNATARSSNQTNQNFDEDLVTEKDDEILMTSDWNTNFCLGRQEKHPADDEEAK